MLNREVTSLQSSKKSILQDQSLNKKNDVCAYALNRLSARWSRFEWRLDKNTDAIVSEWGAALKNWTIDEVDEALLCLERPYWKDRLKTNPPELRDFLSARPSSKNKVFRNENESYFNYIKKWEARLLTLAGYAKNGIMYELLTEVRGFLTNAELNIFQSAPLCFQCTGFAVFCQLMDGEKRYCCWNHTPAIFHDAVNEAKELEKKKPVDAPLPHFMVGGYPNPMPRVDR